MHKRKITRYAILQDYTGSPEKLLPELDEVAAKGYHAVAFWAPNEQLDTFRTLCERAAELGLGVGVLTGYMKYQYKYIAEHPDQRMVHAEDRPDQDGLSRSGWGCPFNPELKARYFQLLRELASCPGVVRIWVNDEASLGSGCYCPKCQQDYAADIGGEMPRKVQPVKEDWQGPIWRRYLNWKIDRWNNVHGEMAEVIHQVNSGIEVAFQASPASDLWRNPWSTCIDLHAMARQLDSISTDPYYTFHRRCFEPAEVYLSEWSRFLHGIMPAGKRAEIIPQAFSHPVFTRPLGEQDGLWSAVIPLACGIDIVTPYTYTLQRCSPVQAVYEKCFELDPYFERVTPLSFAAVVHGVQTEIYHRPLPVETPRSYDGTRVLPVTESLRHRGVPYGYLPDARLDETEALSAYQVVILPEVNCLSKAQEEGLVRFIENGGNVVILGQLGIADEAGEPRTGSLLEEITGIRITSETDEERAFHFVGRDPVADSIQQVDDTSAARYADGTMAPLLRLRCCLDAQLPDDAELLAEFTDDDGRPTGQPAIALLPRGGNILWLAGFPSRTTSNPRYGTTPRNLAHQYFAALVEWAAGEKPALRVEGWPPDVPMKQLRPLDARYMSTFEFFPLAGDNLFLGVVTSYFREPTHFPMVLDVPVGRELVKVTELLSGEAVPLDCDGAAARVQVEMGFDTAALVFLFELGKETPR